METGGPADPATRRVLAAAVGVLACYWAWLGLLSFSHAIVPAALDPMAAHGLAGIVSSVGGAGVAIGVGIAYSLRPRWFDGGKHVIQGWLLLFAGVAGSGLAVFAPFGALSLALGIALASVAGGVFLFGACAALVRLRMSGERIVAAFSLSLVLGVAAYGVGNLFDGMLGAALCLACPLGCFAGWLALSFEIVAFADGSDGASTAAASAKPSLATALKGLPWRLIVGLSLIGSLIGLLQVPIGLTQGQDLLLQTDSVHVLFRAVGALTALLLVVKFGRAYWSLSNVGVVCVVIGLCFLLTHWQGSAVLSSAFISVGFTCIEVLIWVVLFEIAAESNLAFPLLYAAVRGVFTVGMTVGTVVAVVLTRLPFYGFGDGVTLVLIAGTLCLAQAVFASRDIASLWGMPRVVSKAVEQRPDEIIASLGERYGLSPRELEVAILWAKGRSETYISETLFISPHTTHSHIRHMYAKMAVHSRQEFIDRLEKPS